MTRIVRLSTVSVSTLFATACSFRRVYRPEKPSRLTRSRVEGSRFSESCNPDGVVVSCSAEVLLQSIVIISRAPTPAK